MPSIQATAFRIFDFHLGISSIVIELILQLYHESCIIVFMDLYEKIGDILFKIGQEVRVHKMPDGNLILDIDYEDYIEEIVNLFEDYLDYIAEEE